MVIKITWNKAEMCNIIENRAQRIGLYLLGPSERGEPWLACDNSTGEAWVEEFRKIRDAIRWLRRRERVLIDRTSKAALENFYIYMADLTQEAKQRLNRVYERQGWEKASDNELVTTVEVSRCDI